MAYDVSTLSHVCICSVLTNQEKVNLPWTFHFARFTWYCWPNNCSEYSVVFCACDMLSLCLACMPIIIQIAIIYARMCFLSADLVLLCPLPLKNQTLGNLFSFESEWCFISQRVIVSPVCNCAWYFAVWSLPLESCCLFVVGLVCSISKGVEKQYFDMMSRRHHATQCTIDYFGVRQPTKLRLRKQIGTS